VSGIAAAEGAVANPLGPSAWSSGGQPASSGTFIEVAGVGAAGP
jgi:hypothetical protein